MLYTAFQDINNIICYSLALLEYILKYTTNSYIVTEFDPSTSYMRVEHLTPWFLICGAGRGTQECFKESITSVSKMLFSKIDQKC